MPLGSDPLLRIIQKDGLFWVDKASPNTASKKLWRVVRDGQPSGHILTEGDIIKLGRFKFKVRQLGMNPASQPELRLEDAGGACCPAQLDHEALASTLCRICLLEGSTEEDPLITPCLCKGSIEFVHLGCLRYWIRGRLNLTDGASGGSYFYRPLACELCKATYPTYVNLAQDRVPLVEVPRTTPPFIVLENLVELKAVPLAPSVQERFMAKMSGAHIKPAFHGTDTRNYESIFSRGLLIPGYQNELQIAHGAAHGRGIYTANIDASWLSRGFCASSSMLVCAVRQENVTHVGDAMVVFDPDNVVPLFEGYLPEGASVRYQETSWSTGSALQAGVMQLQATRQASSKPPPGKPAPAKSATTAEAAPAKPAKKSKFLTRLAAKSKKH